MSVMRRHYTWRGVRWAAGVVIDEARLGTPLSRRRVLAAWEVGARCYRWDAGILLLWSTPRMLDARYAPGALVLRHGDGLTSVPVDPLAPTPVPGELVGARHGQVSSLPLDEAHAEDPSRWIDTGRFTLATPCSLRPEAKVAVFAAPDPPRSPRAVLGPGVPAPAPALDAFREALERRRHEQARAATGGSPWLARLRGWLGKGPRNGRQQAGGRERIHMPSAAPSGPGLLARLFIGVLERTRLAQAIGLRQARYLRRMLRMFEDGDLKEALRHAVPLGDGEPPRPLSALLPGRRDDLSIATQPASAGGSLLVGGEEIHEHLRRTYRGAARRLEQMGQIAEAAFVLVELLGEVEEAVDLLERHRRFHQAAEIAEGRGLPPGRVVRQWVLAGEIQRAIDTARLHGAFGDAIVRIEPSHPKEAATLRLRWAGELASGGDYAAAVDVVWPIEEARALTLEWVRLGAALGGEVGARLQIRRLVLQPEAFDSVKAGLCALLAQEAPEQAGERLAVARALLHETRGRRPLPDALRPIAGLACRAMLRDTGQGLLGFSRRDCERLARAGQDALLLADMPSFEDARKALPPPAEIVIAAGDVGASPVRDALRLPSARLLIAEGERGVRLLTRDGRNIARFDVPADHLVISDTGARALALARRGSVLRMARIELDTLKSREWGTIEVDHWAPTYDGTYWIVSEGATLRVLDVLSEQPRCVWQVTEVGRRGIVHLARSPTGVHLLASEPTGLDYWRYEIPGMTLRARCGVPDAAQRQAPEGCAEIGPVSLSTQGDVLAFGGGSDEDPVPTRINAWNDRSGHFGFALPDGLASDLIPLTHGRVMLGAVDQGNASIVVLGRHTDYALLRVSLHGCDALGMRADWDHVLIWDDRARLLVLDLDTLRLEQNLRL